LRDLEAKSEALWAVIPADFEAQRSMLKCRMEKRKSVVKTSKGKKEEGTERRRFKGKVLESCE